MSCELVLSPAGRLHFDAGDGAGAEASDRWLNKVSAEFRVSGAAGLFALAASRPEQPLSAPLSFWRGFASTYLTELCRTPESAAIQIDEIAAPQESDLANMLLSAPPMGGGEYLCLDVLRALWRELDRWTRAGIAGSESGLSEWLKKHAPLWHQVGRVCFHLAENRGDPEFPFAFLATYAQGLSDAGRVQYRPLGRALQEYSGERNRKALINLLSPVNRARERVDFVRELLDSGELFEPLAWTSAEAYRFLTDVAALEESGILVRLPDWWRKRPRPRVSVTIGERRPGNLGAEAMLSFKVGVALDDRTLTEEEWQALLASGDGLVQIRGKWVEVDAERLSLLLDRWKQAEQAGEGAISFIEGMRLLAGASAKLDADGISSSEDRQWAFIDAGSWLSEVLEGLRNPERLDSG
ncbi:MAG TPA: SNF2 helicase-associated domain-containing protein, partial [Spirochaetia bacterium]|nr:SNF2 helicase-associated domain-containing protein [Spirochaetia bacterium]